MGVPTQVDEAAELAEQLHERLFSDSGNVEDEVVDTDEDNEDREANNDDEDDSNEYDVPPDDDIEELRKFKARYLSLKGKYDAEVPRLHSELKEFKQNVFDRLESMTTKPKAEPQGEPDEIARFKEEYGEDFVENLRKFIRLESKSELADTITSVQQQVSSVEETQVKVAQENFKNYIDSQVKGDWRSAWEGKDPKFIEFLQKPDPSGLYTYADLVQAYNDAWDADKLSKVFNLYYADTQKPEVDTRPKKEPNPAQQAMVAPSRNNVHTVPNTNDKQIWTQDSIKEFQRLDRQGKYTSEVSKAMWDDLLSAMSEGRIK